MRGIKTASTLLFALGVSFVAAQVHADQRVLRAAGFGLRSSAGGNQNSTWQIDSDYSNARFSLSVSTGSNITFAAAKVGGTASIDRTSPVKSALILEIYPAGTNPHALDPRDGLIPGSFSDLPSPTVLSFRTRWVTRTTDGKLEMTGDLVLTRVEYPATITPSEAYAGPAYGDPVVNAVTRQVTLVVETSGLADTQTQPNGRIAISAIATITDQSFPELHKSITHTNWPPLVQDEKCQMPATVGEDYHGGVCAGTPLNLLSFHELPVVAGEDYHGPESWSLPRDNKLTITLHLELTNQTSLESLTRSRAAH